MQYDHPERLEDDRFTVGWARAACIQEHVELAARQHHLHADLVLDRNAPGSYPGRRFSVRWTVTVRVSIPWWPDATRTVELFVVQRGDTTRVVGPAPPRLFVSDLRGPVGQAPYVEVSLNSTTAVAGQPLHGYVSLANTAHNHYFAIGIRLVQRVHRQFHHQPLTSVEPVAHQFLPIKTATENTALPFSIAVPPTLVSGFKVFRVQMQWLLQVETRINGRPPLRLDIPVEVAPSTTPLPQAHGAPSLAAIGSARVHNIWRQAASDTGFSLEAGGLVRRFGADTLTLSLRNDEHSGKQLAVDLHMREVDIGLHSNRGRLQCRDPEHTQQIVSATEAVIARRRANHVDDRHVQFLIDDGGRRREAVVRWARWGEAVAHALLQARAALGPAASAAHLLPEFERAAERLGGRLSPAGMDVWGHREPLPFSLETRWGERDALLDITIAVGTSIAIDGRFHGAFFAPNWPETLPEGVAELLHDAMGLTVSANGIEIHFAPEAGTIDDRVEALETLIGIGQRLSMLAGVYR